MACRFDPKETLLDSRLFSPVFSEPDCPPLLDEKIWNIYCRNIELANSQMEDIQELDCEETETQPIGSWLEKIDETEKQIQIEELILEDQLTRALLEYGPFKLGFARKKRKTFRRDYPLLKFNIFFNKLRAYKKGAFRIIH